MVGIIGVVGFFLIFCGIMALFGKDAALWKIMSHNPDWMGDYKPTTFRDLIVAAAQAIVSLGPALAFCAACMTVH